MNSPEVRVVVTDVEMPFWSIVFFMLKWAIATVPALFILAGVGFILSFAGAAIAAALGHALGK